ncbi:MAG: hypothetical protein ACOCP2_01320 [Halohasta sp.]
MQQYIEVGETELSPVVVVTTLLLIAAFVLGFGNLLLMSLL